MKRHFLYVLTALFLALQLISPTVSASDLSGADSPASFLTRGEALDRIWREEGSPDPGNGDVPFTDLGDSPYRDAVTWALENGVTNGISETLFAPEASVTRTQIAAFLYRLAKEPGKVGNGEWYSDALHWALRNMDTFGSALPLSTAEDDLCSREELDALLERRAARSDREGSVYVLYTSDVHCGVAQGFGYAGLEEIRAGLEEQGYETILVDDGDAIQGEPLGSLTKGEASIRLMSAMNYDAAIPGNHEFDYGTDRFLELTGIASHPYISCNILKNGKHLFPPYRIVEAGGRKIGFVGVTTPMTLSSSNPRIFMDDTGAFIYDFLIDSTGEAVYAAVQQAVDDARADGAELVYMMGHLGYEAECEPWTYADVISATAGIDVVLDGHSHDTEQVVMKNRDGNDVVRSACGTKMNCVGYSRISGDGRIAETGIWSWSNPQPAPEVYAIRNEIRDLTEAAAAEVEAALGEAFAVSEVDLWIDDPNVRDLSGNLIRIGRRAETNMGDFCADALRVVLGTDIGLWNGGSLRQNMSAGDITHRDILAVVPFGNEVSVIEVTGQQILDALEWGAKSVPEQDGAFLQVSGLRYEIDVSTPSGCLADDAGFCIGYEGERRVRNVMAVDGPIDPERLYTLAGIDFLLFDNGNGMTAFDGASVLRENVMTDTAVLEEYITDYLHGKIGTEYENPYGEGRVTIIDVETP